ncbi:MAG: LysR family transcriptional regulator [Gammaproteobacteria bacterium]
MGILDDTAIFTAIIQQGGFSRAAKHLGISNALVSRRMSQLELTLGVTLIKRTTRQLKLTPEGELLWQHAERIQKEFDSAISLIQSSSQKPTGTIRISSPIYFGKRYLTNMVIQFLNNFNDIKIDLILTNEKLDPIKDKLDLMIRGAGYYSETSLPDSSMQMKLLIKEKIGLYASPDYLVKHGEPTKVNMLSEHKIIHFISDSTVSTEGAWTYHAKDKDENIIFKPAYSSNDIDSNLIACVAGCGIGRFTELNVKTELEQQKLRPILTQYDWGSYHLYAVYPKQEALPKRTRLLLDFINVHMQSFRKVG